MKGANQVELGMSPSLQQGLQNMWGSIDSHCPGHQLGNQVGRQVGTRFVVVVAVGTTEKNMLKSIILHRINLYVLGKPFSVPLYGVYSVKLFPHNHVLTPNSDQEVHMGGSGLTGKTSFCFLKAFLFRLLIAGKLKTSLLGFFNLLADLVNKEINSFNFLVD